MPTFFYIKLKSFGLLLVLGNEIQAASIVQRTVEGWKSYLRQ